MPQIIDAGHYSIIRGPTPLDTYLWEQGVSFFVESSRALSGSGLMLLVDDMSGIESNAQRRELDLDLPDSYAAILDRHKVSKGVVRIISQHQMREKGKKLLRRRELSRSAVSQCELVVAATVRLKAREGFTSTIGFYDDQKTAGGINLVVGTEKAAQIFGTPLEYEYRIFSDPSTYRIFKSPQSGTL